jgi:hypothetical protein
VKNIGILKLLTFLFIFVFVVFLVLFIFIVPSIKELRNAKIANAKAYNRYTYAVNEQRSKEKELKKLKHDNLKIIRAFEARFKESDFLKFSKKYFKQVSLSKEKSRVYKKEFVVYDFHTISKITEPNVFYRFLTDINRYDNIIQADFPIQMQAVKDDINTTFKLKVYKLKRSKSN